MVRLKDDRGAIEEALLARQVATHRANLTLANAGSAFAGLVLVAMQWGAVPAHALASWFAVLSLVLGLRLLVFSQPRQRRDGVRDHQSQLLRFRLAFFAHGVAWGLASWLPLPNGDAVHLALLVIVLVGITASSFTLTAFDRVSALCFGLPALGQVVLQLLVRGDPAYALLGVAGVGLLGFLSLTAGRAHRFVRKYVALRVAEAEQAESLRSSGELLDRTGATAGIGGWELDVATMTLRLTAQAFRIHGTPPVRRPTYEGFVSLYAPAQQAELRAGLAETMAHGTPCDRELPLTTADGSRRWVRLIGRPQLEHGQVVRISGVVQDITEAKATEQALAEKNQLLTLLVQTTREGFWFTDPQGVTTDVNPAMCAILGRTRDEVIGQSLCAFVDATNADVFTREIERCRRGLPGACEIALTRADGTQVDCFNHSTPIFDAAGRHVGSIGMWIDISERKRAEQRLRVTSELLTQKSRALQVTLDSISQGIASVDAEGRATAYNRRMLELLELPASLFGAGHTFDDIVRFQDARGDFVDGFRFIDPETWTTVAATDCRGVPDLYVRQTRAGGCLEVRTRRLPDGGMVRTYADVTAYFEAQRALHDSQVELRALLDAFPGFIAVADARLVYTYVNERFALLLGLAREDIVGRPVRELIGEARFEVFEQHAARVRSGEQVTLESEYASPDGGEPVWLQVTYASGADAGDDRHKFYAFGIDISERKRAERALIVAKDDAERANRAKSQFLSSMSHELRTPMNAILGFSQLLMADARDPLSERHRDHVREILRGAHHLLELINEVLDLAQIESGKLQVSLEAVQVSGLLQECLSLMRPLARDQTIDITEVDDAACDCHVVADRTRLKQVLLNLLSNAIKYNRPMGRVTIDCRMDGGAVRLAVTDTGPGLSTEQGARLFQAFERLDAGRSSAEGAGLGLALSRRLLEAMGGMIGLDSEVGRGSTFWVRLPRADAPDDGAVAEMRAPVAIEAPTHAARPHKVLYIEDNPINVLLMEAMLALVPDLQLVIAPLPELGLQMAVHERPDLILLDIQLPGMDGYEVLRRLRLDPALRSIPVIAVSANAMESDIQSGLAAGFTRYLTKPLDVRQVLVAVQDTLAAA